MTDLPCMITMHTRMSNKRVESYKLGRADASQFEPHA